MSTYTSISTPKLPPLRTAPAPLRLHELLCDPTLWVIVIMVVIVYLNQ